MHYLNKSGWALLYFLLLCSPVSAHQDLTDSTASLPLHLSEVWEKAARYNKTLLVKQLQVQHSQEEIKDAKAERLPDIGFEGEYARISNLPEYEDGLFHPPVQYEGVIHTSYKVAGEAYLNIYNGNKTNLKIATAQTEHNIAMEQQLLSASDIKLRAAAYYLDMQRSREFRDLLLKDIATREKQLDQIRHLQKSGVVLKSDVLRAALKLSKQKLALTQLNNDLAIANQKLNNLMGIADTVRITPTDTLQLDSLGSYDDYLNEAYENAYPIKISGQETVLRRQQLQAVKANTLPKVGLFASYTYAYPQILLWPYADAAYGLGMTGIKASYNLSSLYHNKHKTSGAQIAYQQQEVEHADTQDHVREAVRAAYLRYREALERVAVSRDNIVQATENARIVHNTYFSQTSLITDLLDADTQLLQTRFDLAAARIAAQLQFYQLENTTGKL